jgi:hypothetical protein
MTPTTCCGEDWPSRTLVMGALQTALGFRSAVCQTVRNPNAVAPGYLCMVRRLIVVRNRVGLKDQR